MYAGEMKEKKKYEKNIQSQRAVTSCGLLLKLKIYNKNNLKIIIIFFFSIILLISFGGSEASEAGFQICMQHITDKQ